MSEKEVLYARQGAVGTITLNRPKRGNALSGPMVNQFVDILNAAIDDPAVRVIVVTGNGKYFCTGMDLTPQDDTPSASDPVAVTQTMFTTLAKSPKPTIARVNGPALGGGVGIVFACNFRIVHPSAYFSMPEVHRGLIPALISEVIVPQLGAFRSKQYMLSGERVSAQESYRVGFVTAVVEDEESLDKKVKEYVDLLLQSGPGAMRDVKLLIDAVDLRGGDQKVVASYVREAFGKMITSEEAAHGIGAFASREKPNWDEFGLGSKQLKPKL
ncbi:EnoyL-CoA hydratase [Lobosporangium transversale]|uniref:ClpP/crotonase-like domain-containing protein n=1 Tax=Lobosporangium transversale TaxID=64571 RepID=A0A1Y2GU88_9FUNG|nr:ClpP/crotonase-like domain-containing protein [Lobosporangium transversale]KAF9897001.1 EnoyL-CoA hydratase [Lobosporangium transversale]ORZ23817.1 ClpP/crotonase-like domain-containing protein [Lobosporangium transversale]|eukprot:XP_021883631.1 ClpP/crotonase-like domain-containing protein [Lobosporangium transversale]